MSTHPTTDGPDGSQTEQPSDGPAREPGSGGDAGSTSQDQPESGGEGGGGGDRAPSEGHAPESPQDSNERADERATVVDPPRD